MFGNLTGDGRTHRTYSDDGLPLQNRSGTFLGAVVPLTVLAWLSVGLRLHTRMFIFRCLGWDDVIILSAMITGTTSTICLSIGYEYGLGQHAQDVFAPDQRTFFKLFWLANASFSMSNALVKLSLLAQYLRAFDVPAMRLACKVLIGLVLAWGATCSFMAWFPCFPPSRFWEFGDTSSCYAYASPKPLAKYETAVSVNASNMAFDVLTWALPVHLLAQASTNHKTKKAIIVLLCLGTLVLGVAAGRCAANGSTASLQPDLFWNLPVIVILGESENRLSCMLGSIPIFWPVIEDAAGRVQEIYRVLITQEFEVSSTRALPHEAAALEVGSYEAPSWAGDGDGDSTRASVRSSAGGSSHEREKGPVLRLSEVSLPDWPEILSSALGSEAEQKEDNRN